MHSLISRRRFLRTSVGLAAAGVAGWWARRLWLPGARASTGQLVPTQDLRLGARELAGGSFSRTRLGGGRLVPAASGPGEYVSPVVRSRLLATHVGVHWQGGTPPAVSFWLRASRDGVSWSEWRPVIVEAGHGPGPAAESFGALIRVDRADHLQFRIALEDGEGDAAVGSVTLTVLNAEDGWPASPLAPSAPSAKPLTYSREAWGANEALRFDSSGEVWPRDYVPTKKVVLHHTATGNGYSSPSAAMADVRAIYTYHASTLGWGDIGYCWLVDKFGNSYEGRRGRDGPGYDGPGGRELVSEDVVGAHALSHNHGTSGVALLGTHESVAPSSAALSKLKDVLEWVCGGDGINPQGSSDYLDASDGWHRGLPNICGHRDVFSTACPGSSLYAQLPGLRSDTGNRLAEPTAPTVAITSAPAQGTRTNRSVSYAWQGSGGSGVWEYSYYLEGWSLDDDVLVVYHSGFNDAHAPDWREWAGDAQARFTLAEPGHYTFHVRVRDALGRVSVYHDSRTLLADVPSMQREPFRGYVPGLSKG